MFGVFYYGFNIGRGIGYIVGEVMVFGYMEFLECWGDRFIYGKVMWEMCIGYGFIDVMYVLRLVVEEVGWKIF